MREAASPGIASRTTRETCKTSHLEKEAGIWPVALEMLPTPVLGAVFTYYLPCLWAGSPVYPRNHTSYRA